MTVPAQRRDAFGPPDNALGAFGWSVLQVPRAFVWLLRERTLQRLLLVPTLLMVAIGFVLLVGAAFASRALVHQYAAPDGTFAAMLEVLVLFVVLALAAIFMTWQAQGALAAPALERMTLEVERLVDGAAPTPAVGALEVARRALRALFPRVRGLIIWALTAAAGATLVLIPVAGPVVAVVVQVAIAALFLAHGTITDNRARLGLPRRLLLAHPSLVLGLALGLVPFVLVPPLLLLCGGPIAIAGALVALGTRRLRLAGAA